MSPRERMLAMIVLGLLLVGGGGVGGYMLIYSPLQDKNQAADKLQEEVDDLEGKVLKIEKLAPQIATMRKQSLPPDPPDPRDPNKKVTYNFARAEYKRIIERLLQQARITDGRPTTDREITTGRPPVTPEIAAKKPAYTTLVFQIEINKADVWQIVDFLYGYYQLDLLHQITDIKISREDRGGVVRNGLKVLITSEAIAIDGVEPRTTLVPVASAAAAVAGYLGVQAVVFKPELLHRVTKSPLLATKTRDYSFIAMRDMFYGPVPAYVPPPYRPFELAKLDNVTMKRDETTHDVKVKLSGDGAKGAKLTATASGNLLPEGALTVDQQSGTISIPAVDPEASDYAYSKVEVVATAANGETVKKGTFTVSIEKALVAPKPIVLIDGAIRLVIVSHWNDGTARAVIKDNANPFRYEINFSPKGIDIIKEWQATGKTWKRDRDYDKNPPGTLVISDEGETSTNRTFKIIAIEHNALIVSEMVKPQPGKVETKPPTVGKGPPKPPAKPTPTEIATDAAGKIAGTFPQAVYYRWTGGKSLKELVKLKPDEVKAILDRVATEGPLGAGIIAGDK
jgi:hypothetical protein